jgi:hypothetical protein
VPLLNNCPGRQLSIDDCPAIGLPLFKLIYNLKSDFIFTGLLREMTTITCFDKETCRGESCCTVVVDGNDDMVKCCPGTENKTILLRMPDCSSPQNALLRWLFLVQRIILQQCLISFEISRYSLSEEARFQG